MSVILKAVIFIFILTGALPKGNTELKRTAELLQYT